VYAIGFADRTCTLDDSICRRSTEEKGALPPPALLQEEGRLSGFDGEGGAYRTIG